VKTLRNFALGAVAAAVLGIGAAAAQEPAKPAARPETAHRHAGHHGDHGHRGQHDQQGCEQGSGEKHGQSQEKDGKHEHTPR